jgi:hypothetical protein
MGHSSPFVSSCTRRQWARRRGARTRRAWLALSLPMMFSLAVVAAGAIAFLAGHGSF